MNVPCKRNSPRGLKIVPEPVKKIVKGTTVTHNGLQATVAWVNKGGLTAAIIFHKIGSCFFPPANWCVDTKELKITPKKGLFLVGGTHLGNW